MMVWMKLTSMLPPERRQTARVSFTSSLPLRTAATGAAPEGSTICLQRSISSKIALAISLSDTVITSSAYRLMIGTVRSPGEPTAMPSAMVAVEAVQMRSRNLSFRL